MAALRRAVVGLALLGAATAQANATENATESGVELATMTAPETSSLAAAASVGAAGFSEQDAVQFAYLSTAAYCGDALSSWSCGLPCQQTPGMKSVRQFSDGGLGANAFVGRLGNQCVLVFRGTDSLNGWASDVRSMTLTALPGCSFQGAPCRVGQGFLDQYQSLSPAIKGGLAAIGCGKSEPLAITGHSLGGALTTLALWDFHQSGQALSKAYTFGSPRVGDAAFAAAFNQALASVPTFRVTRADDPFVYLPEAGTFHHVATEVYFSGQAGARVCQGSGEDRACADQNPQSSVALLMAQCVIPSMCGHLLYMKDMTKGLMSGSSCQGRAPAFLFP